MVTSAPQHLLPWRPPLVCWSQSQMLLSIFLSQPLLQCCLRETCLIRWCLSMALSWCQPGPSHCTPLLGQVPLVAGTAHLSTPASVPPGPPPGTSSIFFQPALLFPLFQISQFLLLVFFTAGQFSLLTHIRTPQFMVSAASGSLFWEDFWFLDYCVSITQPRQVLIRT